MAIWNSCLGCSATILGEPSVHRLCKEIVKAVDSDSSLLNEVAVALETTGVVSGEFGMAEAYERKRQEVLDWLSDPNEKVKSLCQSICRGSRKDARRGNKKGEREYRFDEAPLR